MPPPSPPPHKTTPTITWANLNAITYGTPLSASQLNATASVAGTFSYSPAAGTVLSAGTQTLSVTFTPTDTTDYYSASTSTTIVITQATPTINWVSPSAITYGTQLSVAQLNATASVAGTFGYSPAAGTVLSAGTQALSVTFTPTDSSDYYSASTSVSIIVNQETPTITWTSPNPITYGTALSATQLDATASVPGTFSYSPAVGTLLSAGSQTLQTTFVPSDTVDFAQTTASVPITVNPQNLTPTFQCSPSSIVSGTNLTCVVTLNAGATSPVMLSVGGSAWSSATPNSNGVATATAALAEAPGSYTITYAYPGDASANLPAASGSTTVNVMASGTQVTGNLIYQYQIVQPNGASGYDPTGNLISYNDTVNGAWSLGYDSLNRVISSVAAPINSGAQFGCWAYDSFGNMQTQGISSQSFSNPTTCQAQIGATTLQSSLTYNAANQIISGTWLDASNNSHVGSPVYDAAGETISDMLNNYLYDAQGQVCAVQTGPGSYTGYLYDAEGHRVAKGTLPSLTCDPTNLQITAAYFIGPDGETMTEIDGTGSWVRTEVSGAGQYLATYTPTGLHLPITDWLGTKRVTVNPSLTLNNGIEETCVSFPFGDQLNCTTPIDASPKHFTGKERDSESGLDYFGARYFASSMGRWLSPDWSAKYEPVPYAKLDDPQTLNLYAYVGNNPLNSIDVDGHGAVGDDGNLGIASSEFIPNWNNSLRDHFKAGYSVSLVEPNPDYDPTAQQQSSNADPNQPTIQGVAASGTYSSKKAAAIAAEKAGIGDTRGAAKGGKYEEFGGWVISKGGKFTYTVPVTFGSSTVFYADNVTVPSGYTAVGGYHTHPDPNQFGEGFSVPDMNWAAAHNMTSYVGMSYSGNIRSYTPGVTKYGGYGVTGDLIGNVP